ncbi:N-acetyltransferase family protein [Chitinophagaceae bacterium MMS25-I14]
MEIRVFVPNDWEAVKEIYLLGIRTGNATFQTEAPEWADWDKGHLKFGRLIATLDNKIVGWCALSPVSSRCVYAGVAEVSVYVHTDHLKKGIGSKLLDALIKESELNGIWTLQAGIFPENQGSLAVHTKAGFRIVGYREKIGQMNGAWRDTILLERRSAIIL